jgi:hypothetical protein
MIDRLNATIAARRIATATDLPPWRCDLRHKRQIESTS